jgi:hypothetical protein
VFAAIGRKKNYPAGGSFAGGNLEQAGVAKEEGVGAAGGETSKYSRAIVGRGIGKALAAGEGGHTASSVVVVTHTHHSMARVSLGPGAHGGASVGRER